MQTQLTGVSISETVFFSILSFSSGCLFTAAVAYFIFQQSTRKLDLKINGRLKFIQADKFKSMAEMFSGLAHEVNNPLAIILGRAQTMRMKAKHSKLTPEQMEEGLLKIEGVTQRIAKVVSDLRHVAQDGEKTFPETTGVKKIIDDALTFWRQKLINHEVELRLPTHLAHQTVYCKHTLVVQSLMNLISNSFLAVKDEPEKWIEVQTHRNGEHLEIWILDSGKGVSPDNQSKIFEPFFTTREVGQGSGLGLSISSGIIQEQNGYLKLNTKLDRTCFVVGLPMAKEKLVQTAA
ncbi:MAG: HAMP domain-containing histidine kinase [Proteobacteria bacterium]|jgi:C4-dicarboxylate-specific signal transduction histidine kinase|nr:HAMP domain-containing histidine kinase [Pseudomonadota bacterium]